MCNGFRNPCFFKCANIGPADYNYDETISTLRYANRAKNIRNRARVNEDPKDALLRQFQNEIAALKQRLEGCEDGDDNGGSLLLSLAYSGKLLERFLRLAYLLTAYSMPNLGKKFPCCTYLNSDMLGSKYLLTGRFHEKLL